MSTVTQTQSAKGSTTLNLGTLASATYAASSSIDRGAAISLDETIEVECDPNGTPSGNMELLVFVQVSLDDTDFSTGPTSGTTDTNENDLYYLGAVPCNDTSEHRKTFSLVQSNVPVTRYYKIVCKNDMGVALTSGNVFVVSIKGDIT
jgi:hypothetical protein